MQHTIIQQIDHYMETVEKYRQHVMGILKAADFDTLPKQFYQVIMILLEINDFKAMNVKIAAQKIIGIYQRCKGNYQKYLTQKKFNGLHEELKQYVWNIFKKFHEYFISQRLPERPQNFYNNPQMNMNMLNMFMNIPSFQNVEQIQFFQKKMYEVCKNSIPKIIQGLAMGAQNCSPPMFRSNNTNNFPRNSQNSYRTPDLDMMSPGSFMPYYPSSSSNMNYMSKPWMNGNKNLNPYNKMENNNNSRNHPREEEDQFMNMRNKPNFSHNKITSPTKGIQKRPYYSQNNIHYDSQFPISSSHHEGFTLYPTGERFGERKLPKTFNKNNEDKNMNQFQQQQQYEPTPRKIVKKDDDVVSIKFGGGDKQVIICTCIGRNIIPCTYCLIHKFDPFNDVEEIIKTQHISSIASEFTIQIDRRIKAQILRDKQNYDIEIRSFCLDNENQQIQWPQNFTIFINDSQFSDFTGGSKKKISKKQTQVPLLLSKQIDQLQQTEKICIKGVKKQDQTQTPDNRTYVIAILLIKKQSVHKLNQQIKNKIIIQNLSEFFTKSNHDIDTSQYNKINIVPIDNLTKQIINDPVRGINCDHPQCFDLKTFLQYQKFADNRNWKCPLCSKLCKQFVLDQQLKQIFSDVKRMIKQPNNIIIFKSGGYKFVYQDEKKQRKKIQQKLPIISLRSNPKEQIAENYDSQAHRQQNIENEDKTNNDHLL